MIVVALRKERSVLGNAGGSSGTRRVFVWHLSPLQCDETHQHHSLPCLGVGPEEALNQFSCFLVGGLSLKGARGSGISDPGRRAAVAISLQTGAGVPAPVLPKDSRLQVAVLALVAMGSLRRKASD